MIRNVHIAVKETGSTSQGNNGRGGREEDRVTMFGCANCSLCEWRPLRCLVSRAVSLRGRELIGQLKRMKSICPVKKGGLTCAKALRHKEATRAQRTEGR